MIRNLLKNKKALCCLELLQLRKPFNGREGSKIIASSDKSFKKERGAKNRMTYTSYTFRMEFNQGDKEGRQSNNVCHGCKCQGEGRNVRVTSHVSKGSAAILDSPSSPPPLQGLTFFFCVQFCPRTLHKTHNKKINCIYSFNSCMSGRNI